MSKDYYEILGVEKGASADEIKKAFKKSAMRHHPDRPGGDEAKFKEANEAYRVLGDRDKREKYDQFGSDFEQQGGFGGAGGWEDFMRAARSGHGGSGDGNFSFNFGGADLGDIFGDLFSAQGGAASDGGGRRGQRVRGRDIQVDVEIDFKEAAFGVEKEISLRKQTKCDVCNGNGAEPGGKMEKCKTCGGQGQVMQKQRTIFGVIQSAVLCPDCNGRGEKPSKKCKHCGGDGILSKNSNVKVKLPAGINDGEAVRLSDYGEAAPHGGATGDLYIRVHVRPHKGWERDNFDVYSELEINFSQAVLGDKVNIETLDGTEKMVVPEGVESGQSIRLRGHGVTHPGRATRGDHYVKIKIRVPRKVSREVKKKLEELKGEL